jgi:hypothetical protein
LSEALHQLQERSPEELIVARGEKLAGYGKFKELSVG